MGVIARIAAGIVIAAFGCGTSTPSGEKSEPAHWGYDGKGEPQRWGELDPRYAACQKGHFQSPIDLHVVAKRLARPLSLDYRPDALRLVNNGHTVQVQHQGGSTLTIGDRTYTLAQYHVHSPSEHTTEGRRHALELHFVHTHPSGDLAVLGVLVDEGAEQGAEARAIAQVWAHLPAHAGESFTGDAVVDPQELLPPSLDHYQYHGSLTTPPCTEVVDWSVLAEPIRMSRRFAGSTAPTRGRSSRARTGAWSRSSTRRPQAERCPRRSRRGEGRKSRHAANGAENGRSECRTLSPR
jgi:carbonic anhydrase